MNRNEIATIVMRKVVEGMEHQMVCRHGLLHLNPATETWKCAICNYEMADEQIDKALGAIAA